MMDRLFFKAGELRAQSTNDGLQINGFAAWYNSLSNAFQAADGTLYYERILPGAFDRVIRSKPDVVCLFNHDANKVLGRTTSGTLRITASPRGLAYSCDLPNTQIARDLHEAIKRGDVGGSSFAFIPHDEDSTWGTENVGGKRCIVRSIRNVSSLMDVSPCTHPKYNDTSVGTRSAVNVPSIAHWTLLAKRMGMQNASLQDVVAAERRFAKLQREIAEQRAMLFAEIAQQQASANSRRAIINDLL
jgi:HK97 family phage prohead protease